jgi:hypothetical protein
MVAALFFSMVTKILTQHLLVPHALRYQSQFVAFYRVR